MQKMKVKKIKEAMEMKRVMTTGQINDYLNDHLKWGSGGMMSVVNIIKKIKGIEKIGFEKSIKNGSRNRQIIWGLKEDLV